MEYTENQKRHFKEQFASLKKRQLIATIPFVGVFAVLVAADQATATAFGLPVFLWGPIVAVYVVGLVIFSLRNWRCPACEKYLGKGFGPKFCPKCGVQLSD